MYEEEATEHQAGLFGLKLEEMPDEVIEIWDVNLPAYEWFSSIGSQWRYGMNGPTGLDYTACESTARMMGFKKKQIREMFPDLQVMENEALLTIREIMDNANDSGTPD